MRRRTDSEHDGPYDFFICVYRSMQKRRVTFVTYKTILRCFRSVKLPVGVKKEQKATFLPIKI